MILIVDAVDAVDAVDDAGVVVVAGAVSMSVVADFAKEG
jgi:hypothetical protein